MKEPNANSYPAAQIKEEKQQKATASILNYNPNDFPIDKWTTLLRGTRADCRQDKVDGQREREVQVLGLAKTYHKRHKQL